MTYLWLKAAHVSAVLVFAGGVLALFSVSGVLDKRLAGGPERQRALIAAILFWDRRVTVPAMIAAWGFGLWIATSGNWFSNGWLQAKLLLVVTLSGLHGMTMGRLRRRRDHAPADERLVPLPILVMIGASVFGIVVLAVVKPG